MKRILSILLVLTVVASVFTATSIFQARAALGMMGDINGDGSVDNRDLSRLQQYVNKWDVTVDGEADMNGDGSVDNRDLSALQQQLNGHQPKASATTPLSKYVSLGAPAAAHYPSIRYVARCAWDMTIHGGRLYVGCGDFNMNTGSAPVLSAPLSDPDNWSVEATLPDEQVGRFYDYNGVLTIPGFDPLKQPEYGTYYQLMNGQWQTVAVLPHGLHNFDLAWFEGQLFAAIGAPGGSSPVVVTDDGVNFRDLPLYKDGEPVENDPNSVVRSMNLYVLDGTLYADYWCTKSETQPAAFEMYRYDPETETMVFVVDMKTQTHGGKFSSAGLPLWEKEALGDKMFLTTGYLYYTTDMQNYTQIDLPGDATAFDMMAYNGRMYILSSYKSGTGYRIQVHSVSSAKPTTLREEVSFTYKQMPTAMTMDGDNFFIAIGNWYDTGAAENGTILQFKR